MNSWIWKDDFFNEDVSKYYGFIYKLEYKYNDDTYVYWGRKQFNSYLEMDALKSGKSRDNHIEFVNRNKSGKRLKREVVCKESDWKLYTGSCKHEKIDEMILVSKEIVRLVPYDVKAKTTLTYYENDILHKMNALFDKYCLNNNISGRMFVGRIQGDKLDD